MVNLPSGNRLVGFADTGMTQVCANLGWIVMVAQNEREALSSVRTLVYFAIFMLVVALLMVSGYLLLRASQTGAIRCRNSACAGERTGRTHGAALTAPNNTKLGNNFLSLTTVTLIGISSAT